MLPVRIKVFLERNGDKDGKRLVRRTGKRNSNGRGGKEKGTGMYPLSHRVQDNGGGYS